MLRKLLALVGWKLPLYPPAVIRIMRGLQKDEEAFMNVELCRGVPFWSDEGYNEICQACWQVGCERTDDPFFYRLYLLTGEQKDGIDYQRCEESWNYLKQHCPTWPGFDATRRDPVRGPEIMVRTAEMYAML